MKKSIIAFMLCALTLTNATAQTPLWQGEGRIALSSDGNEHDDDDWSATPFTLALLSAAGLQDRVTLYTYSDHIWGSNQDQPFKSGMSAYEHMRESAVVGGRMFGFDKTQFICAVDNAEVAYRAMSKQINQSTESDPLIIIAAGPMQVVGEALNRSNKEALKHVTVISHSTWNNVHSDNTIELRKLRNDDRKPPYWDIHEGWTWDEMKDNFAAEGVKFVKIRDQNGAGEDKGLLCNQKYFDWLKETPSKGLKHYKEGSLEWLYSRLGVAIKNKNCFDISDAGMTVYLLTGRAENTAEDVRKIIENPLQPDKW